MIVCGPADAMSTLCDCAAVGLFSAILLRYRRQGRLLCLSSARKRDRPPKEPASAQCSLLMILMSYGHDALLLGEAAKGHAYIGQLLQAGAIAKRLEQNAKPTHWWL